MSNTDIKLPDNIMYTLSLSECLSSSYISFKPTILHLHSLANLEFSMDTCAILSWFSSPVLRWRSCSRSTREMLRRLLWNNVLPTSGLMICSSPRKTSTWWRVNSDWGLLDTTECATCFIALAGCVPRSAWAATRLLRLNSSTSCLLYHDDLISSVVLGCVTMSVEVSENRNRFFCGEAANEFRGDAILLYFLAL